MAKNKQSNSIELIANASRSFYQQKYYKLTNRGGSIQYWLITNHHSQISFQEPPPIIFLYKI